MKKNIIFILLLGISTLVSAQQSEINFGIKGGYSLSDMKLSDTSLDSKSFFYIGALAEKPLSPKMGLQAELLYSQVGGKYTYPLIQLIGNEIVNAGNATTDFQLNQLQVPISLKYYFIPNFSASAGLNFGFSLSKKIKSEMPYSESYTEDSDFAKTLNLFPFLGLEYKISQKFFVDARYHFNFFEVNKSNAIPVKIGFLQAGIGYRFK